MAICESTSMRVHIRARFLLCSGHWIFHNLNKTRPTTRSNKKQCLRYTSSVRAPPKSKRLSIRLAESLIKLSARRILNLWSRNVLEASCARLKEKHQGSSVLPYKGGGTTINGVGTALNGTSPPLSAISIQYS